MPSSASTGSPAVWNCRTRPSRHALRDESYPVSESLASSTVCRAEQTETHLSATPSTLIGHVVGVGDRWQCPVGYAIGGYVSGAVTADAAPGVRLGIGYWCSGTRAVVASGVAGAGLYLSVNHAPIANTTPAIRLPTARSGW